MTYQNKIVFAGPVGVGKTTAIGNISDLPPVATEARATDETQAKKESTTVALDYGSIKLDDGTSINLYGTPGQQRFDFMWQVLCQGAIGLVLMIDDKAESPLDDLVFFLDTFSEYFSSREIVIGINKCDPFERGRLSLYQETIAARYLSIPVLEIDARNPDDIATMVQCLLLNIDPGLEAV